MEEKQQEILTSKTYVYFVKRTDFEVVKIGRSNNPLGRFSSLKTSSPVALELIGFMPEVPGLTEAELHERFAEDRTNGEWFRLSTPICALLKEHREKMDWHVKSLKGTVSAREFADAESDRFLKLSQLEKELKKELSSRVLLRKAVVCMTEMAEHAAKLANIASQDRLISMVEMKEKTGLCGPNVLHLVELGKLPPPIEGVSTKGKKKLWLERDVNTAIVKLARDSYGRRKYTYSDPTLRPATSDESEGG